MNLNQIPKMVSYKEKVYAELKQAILSNELKQGEMLNERTLAAKLGISRTPIREALHLLENEGWVATEPCKGTWVREVTAKDIAEVYQMRLALEPLAVELAIHRSNRAAMLELTRMMEEQSKIVPNMDDRTFTDMDMNFHLYIVKISENRRLLQTMSSFMDVMSMYVIRTIRKTQPYSVPIGEHAEILDAMLKQDILAAKSAVVRHINRAFSAAVENLE